MNGPSDLFRTKSHARRKLGDDPNVYYSARLESFNAYIRRWKPQRSPATFDSSTKLLLELERALEERSATITESAANGDVIADINQALALEQKVTTYLDLQRFDAPPASMMEQVRGQVVPLQSRLTVVYNQWMRQLASLSSDTVQTLPQDMLPVRVHAQEQAPHELDVQTEQVIATLTRTGSLAWQNLFRQQLAGLMVEVPSAGGTTNTLPFHVALGMAMSPDREQRRTVTIAADLLRSPRVATSSAPRFECRSKVKPLLLPSCAATTTIAGDIGSYRLNSAAFMAMRASLEQALPTLRRFLTAKAAALQLPTLAFFDLLAPASPLVPRWTLDDALAFVRDEFAAFGPELAAVVDRALQEQWLRVRAGGLSACAFPIEDDISYMRADFSGLALNVRLFGHEFGHIYHQTRLAARPMMLRKYPIPLAETASLFCEQLVDEGLLRRAVPEDQFSTLDASLSEAIGLLLLQWAQVEFEDALFARRQDRELTVNELNDLMVSSLYATFGSTLESTSHLEALWLMQNQLFEKSYWTIPYMFGRLFSIGLLGLYRQNPIAFRQGYDAFLAASGEHDVVTLARTMEIDLEDTAFWEGTLQLFAQRIDQYEALRTSLDTSAPV